MCLFVTCLLGLLPYSPLNSSTTLMQHVEFCERKKPEKESRCHLVNHTCISNDGDVLCCNEESRGTAPGSGDVALGGVVKTPPFLPCQGLVRRLMT